MTQVARDRLRRFAWGTGGWVVCFALWYPADRLAGLVIPAEWPGGTTLSGPAAEQWVRRWNHHWWLTYAIWFVLTLALWAVENLLCRRRGDASTPENRMTPPGYS